jgi:RND family efflux transporter MFP subunit
MRQLSEKYHPLFKRLLPLLIIGMALLLAVILVATKPKAKPVEISEKAWLVGVEAVQLQTLAPTLTLYGKVESLWASQLTAGVAADVLEVKVIDGDRFSQGDVLVVLDDRDAKLRLAQREAELSEADARIASENTRHATNLEALPREQRLLALTRNEVKRLSGLVTKKVGAQSALDTARQAAERQAISLATREQAVAEYEARLAELQAKRTKAEALRDQAALELERCTIRAPFSGRVSQLRVAPGRRVRVGDALLNVYDTAAMVVRAQIPNRHLPTVQASLARDEALRVQGQVDGRQVSASLRSLAGAVAEGSGGVAGIFEIEASADILQQGRFVRLDLVLPESGNLVSLPHEAIYGTDRVYRMDEQNRMRGIRVERVGEMRTADGLTRVLVRADGLKPGERIVTTQLPNAIDGLLVREASDN